MAAYALAESLEVTDPDTMAEYGKLARESIAQYGGKVLAAGPTETIEGDWTPNRLVLIRVREHGKAQDLVRFAGVSGGLAASSPFGARQFRLHQRSVDASL